MAKSRGSPKTGGRKPGIPNRRTAEIAEKLAALGCDPIEGMARIAANPDASLELRGRMYAELAQYVAPKRKAIEHRGEPQGPLLQTTIILEDSDEVTAGMPWRGLPACSRPAINEHLNAAP